LTGILVLFAWAWLQVFVFDNGSKYKCPKCGEIIKTKDFNKKIEYYELNKKEK